MTGRVDGPRAKIIRPRPPRSTPGSMIQDEGDLHDDLIFRDLLVLDKDPLLLDPGAPHVPEGLGRTFDALLDGILEALAGCDAQLGNPGDGHGSFSFSKGKSSAFPTDHDSQHTVLGLPMGADAPDEEYPRSGDGFRFPCPKSPSDLSPEGRALAQVIDSVFHTPSSPSQGKEGRCVGHTSEICAKRAVMTRYDPPDQRKHPWAHACSKSLGCHFHTNPIRSAPNEPKGLAPGVPRG